MIKWSFHPLVEWKPFLSILWFLYFHTPYIVWVVVSFVWYIIIPHLAADLNKDGRADVVCVPDDGSMMVWESRSDNENMYDPDSKWIDADFGFCEYQDKQVIFECHLISFILILAFSDILFRTSLTNSWGVSSKNCFHDISYGFS